MLKKVWNTILYGEPKTRFILLTMFFAGFAGLLLLILSITTGFLPLSLLSVAILGCDIAYIKTFDFKKYTLTREQSDVLRYKKKEERKALKEDRRIAKLKERNLETLDPEKISEKLLKKLFYKYKVKKEHVPILIDSFEDEGLSMCPAILWKDALYCYLLIINEKPRMLKFSIYEFNEMSIKLNNPAKPDEEYTGIRASHTMSALFSQCLPNYTVTEDERTHRRSQVKSLYSIGPDIYCPSGSVHNILKILSLNISIPGSRINREEYGPYFRKVYIARLMYRDKIYSPEEYKDKVMTILSEMALNANDTLYHQGIKQMLANGLIPNEYADYAEKRRREGVK